MYIVLLRFSANKEKAGDFMKAHKAWLGGTDEFAARHLLCFVTFWLGLWGTWQIASIIGVVVGTGVPSSWSLDFAIPLVFMALLVPAIKDRATGMAAGVGAVAAVLLIGLPLNLGLLAASALGIGAGVIGDRG